MPPQADGAAGRSPDVCQWINRTDAIREFVTYEGKTQSQRHIKPLHWYVASRLVLEGGFWPHEVTPRPPFVAVHRRGDRFLDFDPSLATGSEATVLGGLKTKSVDVVVTKQGIGPVLAVSCKGMTGALRNLVNRMEETIGECTNLHITYPALVFGYLFVIRAHQALAESQSSGAGGLRSTPRGVAFNDVAIGEGDQPVESLKRFHSALHELTGRRGVREDVSRYEAVALALASVKDERVGEILKSYPESKSPLRIEGFFDALYRRYDERYVYSAPALAALTRRVEWSHESAALAAAHAPVLDYRVRLAG